MNEIKKKFQKNNSTIDFSVININKFMNKTYNKDNKGIIIHHNNNNTTSKNNNLKDNFQYKNEKYRLEMDKKFKRAWSTQNIFINNRQKAYNNNGLNLFNNKNINFYFGASIYSAPTVKQNRIEINRLLKNGRNKRLNYVNNIHNSIMLKESKLYRKKLVSFSKDNSLDNSEKNKFKKKYSMNDMNEINNIKYSLQPNNKRYFLGKNNKRNFSCYELSLKRYKHLEKNYKEKANKLNLNENTLSTNKTNYFSKYLTGKKYIKNIYELNNNKINDVNYLSSNSKNLSEGTTDKNNEYKKFEYLTKKPIINNKKVYINNDIFENNENSFRIYKDVDMSKMSFELNEILFNKKNKIENLKELEKQVIKFKTLKNSQENRLEIMSKQDINSLDKRIFLLQKNLKKYNQISLDYFREINNYIYFIKDKKYILTNILEEENNKKFNLYFDIEKLVTESILKQKELEYLVEIKLFLIQVKNYLLNRPAYFNDVLNESSKKYELAKLIIGLKIETHNQNVIRFLESIPDIKKNELRQATPSSQSISSQSRTKSPQTNKSFLKKKSKKYSQIIPIKNKKSENNITKYLNSMEKKIFDTPEDFIIIFDNIESKNLRLMRENDYIKRNINILQKEYDDIFQSTMFLEKFNDMNKKEEKAIKLRKENILLNERKNNLKNNKNSDEDNNTKNNKKESTTGFYMDINVFKKISYYKMLENYKYKGLFVLEKLLTFIKDFFDLNYTNYGINRGYKMIGRNTLNKILDINIKNINNINKDVINEYILHLLKLYENICEFIKYKDKEYNSISDNKYIIHKKKEEIQLQRKIKNTKLVRQLAEEKRLNGIEKIMKRNNNPKISYKINVDANIVLKNSIKKNKKLEKIGKYKKNILEKEFNFYVNYDENE